MRALFIVNTYFQLITALQIKHSLFAKDSCVLLISDHSNDAMRVAEHLNEENEFEEVHYIRSKGHVKNRSLYVMIKEFVEISTGKKTNSYSHYLYGITELYFDRILFYNFDIDIYGIYSILSSYNKEIECCSFEEGIFSYFNTYSHTEKFRLTRLARKAFGKPDLHKNFSCFYCFYPEFYHGKLKTIRIPRIDKTDPWMSKILGRIFEASYTTDYSKYKYMFFESVFETEGTSINELKMIDVIADIVGKENLLIKQHPRSTVTYFRDNGFNIDSNSNLPFESVHLNTDLSGICFISALSGSTVSTNLIIDDQSKTIFIYPLMDYEKYEKIRNYIDNTKTVIDDLIQKQYLKCAWIVHDTDELKEALASPTDKC